MFVVFFFIVFDAYINTFMCSAFTLCMCYIHIQKFRDFKGREIYNMLMLRLFRYYLYTTFVCFRYIANYSRAF